MKTSACTYIKPQSRYIIIGILFITIIKYIFHFNQLWNISLIYYYNYNIDVKQIKSY